MGDHFEELVQIFELMRGNGYPKRHPFAPLVSMMKNEPSILDMNEPSILDMNESISGT